MGGRGKGKREGEVLMEVLTSIKTSLNHGFKYIPSKRDPKRI